MSLLADIFGLTLFSGVGGVLLAALISFFHRQHKTIRIKSFILFSAGALYAVSFLVLLPMAIQASLQSTMIMGSAFIGLMGFFLTEKFFLWSHQHDDADAIRTHSRQITFRMLMAGDTIRNTIMGVAIGAATLVAPTVGILTALAIFVHELSQERGDINVMIRMGYSRQKTLVFNLVSSLASIIGGFGVYLFILFHPASLPFIIAGVTGGFLYIASANMVASVHEETGKKKYVSAYVAPFVMGVFIFLVLTLLFLYV